MSFASDQSMYCAMNTGNVNRFMGALDLQYLEDLAELAYDYRKAKFDFAELAKADTNDAKIARANDAVIRAANKLLAFASEGPT